MKTLRILPIVCLLMLLSGCAVDSEGSAHLLVSNLSSYRVRCLVDDGGLAADFWLESKAEKSVLLEMGEYRVKLELYQGGQAMAGRLYTLSLTKVARVHQIAIDNSWLD